MARLPYAILGIIYAIISSVLVRIFNILHLLPINITSTSPPLTHTELAICIFWSCWTFLGFLIYLFSTIRRLHDLNMNGWWVLGIPLLEGAYILATLLIGGSYHGIHYSASFFVVLALVPGSQGNNKYGSAPGSSTLKNSL